MRRLVRTGARVSAIDVEGGDIEADAFIVCTGAWSNELLRPLGIDPQIYPVRGYSVTLPPGQSAPDVSVTVLNKKIVFSRINGDIRVAGFADFLGFRTEADPRRIGALIDIARESAPQAADYGARENAQWGGFRPMTPDGRPRVGASGVDGLYLNTGHGTLGWTMSCGSGRVLADIVSGRQPAIDMNGLGMERYRFSARRLQPAFVHPSAC